MPSRVADEKTPKVRHSRPMKRPKPTAAMLAERPSYPPPRPRKPKAERKVGDTLKFVQPIEALYPDKDPQALPGEYGTYLGEARLAKAPYNFCEIRIKSGRVLYLVDDGKTFQWVD